MCFSAYGQYSAPQSQWNQSLAPSSFQTPPFAQSVIQHLAPYDVYPTPPPPGITTSSSSLAHALGIPAPPQERKIYHPQESTAFFNNFLSETTKKINPQRQGLNVNTTPPSSPAIAQSSPDPLAMGSSPYTPSTSVVTPQKRKKAHVVIESPLKRHQSRDSSLTPLTSQRTSTPSTATQLNTAPRKPRMEAYVELIPPPKSWLSNTPSLSQKTKGKQKAVYADDDDLGGYGSEDALTHPGRAMSANLSSAVRSSGKRTGDRDDRGMFMLLCCI